MSTVTDQVEQNIDFGFVLPDYAVIECLQSGYAMIKRNPRLLHAPLRRYGKPFLEDQAYPFFARRTIDIFEGWPNEEMTLPGIGVTLMNAAEDPGTQEVSPRGIFDQGKARTTIWGTRSRANIQIAHYAESQREANMLCMATTFILLARRDKLEVEDGLQSASLTIGDYNPNTSLKPEHAFMRMVMLSCVVEDMWATTADPLLAEANVTVDPFSS